MSFKRFRESTETWKKQELLHKLNYGEVSVEVAH